LKGAKLHELLEFLGASDRVAEFENLSSVYQGEIKVETKSSVESELIMALHRKFEHEAITPEMIKQIREILSGSHIEWKKY
jgi:hypothetical protein